VGRRPGPHRERVRASWRAAQGPRSRGPPYAGPVRFVKGHGTGNDFVLLPDPDGSLEPTAALVAAVCDRRTGIGADGVLRVVPSALVAQTQPVAGGPTWFMDYRNADGSVAEMCGNGLRVFARYLLDSGHVSGEEFSVGTRGGSRALRVGPGGDIAADMGAVRILGPGRVNVAGRVCEGLRV